MNLNDIISSYDPTAPLEEASTIPASWYLDPRVAELERRTVFSAWQVAARLEQLEKPGKYDAASARRKWFLIFTSRVFLKTPAWMNWTMRTVFA